MLLLRMELLLEAVFIVVDDRRWMVVNKIRINS